MIVVGYLSLDIPALRGENAEIPSFVAHGGNLYPLPEDGGRLFVYPEKKLWTPERDIGSSGEKETIKRPFIISEINGRKEFFQIRASGETAVKIHRFLKKGDAVVAIGDSNGKIFTVHQIGRWIRL